MMRKTSLNALVISLEFRVEQYQNAFPFSLCLWLFSCKVEITNRQPPLLPGCHLKVYGRWMVVVAVGGCGGVNQF